MASTDAKPVPQKNVAYRVTFPIFDADGDLVTGATGLDSEVSKDGGTFADCTNEATEIATSSGIYYLDLTSTEMDADTVAIIVKTSSSGAKTTPIVMYPEEAGDIRVNATHFAGTAYASADFSATMKASINAEADTALADYDGPTNAEMVARTLLAAEYGTAANQVTIAGYLDTEIAALTAAVADIPTNAELTTALGTADDATLAAIAALSIPSANTIADAVLVRAVSNVEDSATVLSLAGIILGTFESSISGTTWQINKTDGSTSFATRTLTKTAGDAPIRGVT